MIYFFFTYLIINAFFIFSLLISEDSNTLDSYPKWFLILFPGPYIIALVVAIFFLTYIMFCKIKFKYFYKYGKIINNSIVLNKEWRKRDLLMQEGLIQTSNGNKYLINI